MTTGADLNVAQAHLAQTTQFATHATLIPSTP